MSTGRAGQGSTYLRFASLRFVSLRFVLVAGRRFTRPRRGREEDQEGQRNGLLGTGILADVTQDAIFRCAQDRLLIYLR